MRRFRHLTARHRTPATNEALSLLLAFNAGAVNAGGFLVLHTYTSHMSGFTSQLADALALRDVGLLRHALGALLAFVAGAGVCAALVNGARRRGLRSIYAPPLCLEAALMLTFAAAGESLQAAAAIPLLAFMMGLQNAVGTKSSGGSLRTTHMTGNLTDLGMELGKLLYWNRARPQARERVVHDPKRLRRAGALVALFAAGGVVGTLGVARHGVASVVAPLALLLLALALPPLLRSAR